MNGASKHGGGGRMRQGEVGVISGVRLSVGNRGIKRGKIRTGS